ncbi:hypothetical protein GR160_18410 [Flavobacterium sp. Sd200]|uniref:hypothetical protein n=1 Tax=Flavobacterium sp. Sd200 TaxID=2692211 RepID=UPI0013695F79|nr:hypothetical protein [Flavobacterium sp. Sd200]MXN93206.1 hypothetical protein [Flavobacterium sp. Sd200]
MKFYYCLVAALFFVATACTLDKTDYEAEISTEVPEYYEFKEAALINSGIYRISIETLNGTFYKGYNELHLKILNTQTNQNLATENVTFLPVLTNSEGNVSSCPHQYNLVYDAQNGYYKGYSVFAQQSSAAQNWKLYINFADNNPSVSVNADVMVMEQTNKNLNMTAFTGNDGQQYYIALIAPQRPGVAENDLVAGIYKYNEPEVPAGTFPDPSQFSYSEVEGYTLRLDPRMPEPSMGNHSSPNNRDLTQREDGLYQGVVNYTMTGNWTLNFILLNQNGLIVKGTEVPTTFTPGVMGAKSELFIDILF